MTGTLHEDLCKFMIIAPWFLLKIKKNIVDKSCRASENTHFMFNNSPPENRALYELMLKNVVQPDRPQITVKYIAEKMQFACRITKARIQTYSYGVILFNVVYTVHHLTVCI